MDQKQILEYIKNLEQLTKFLKTLVVEEFEEPVDEIAEFTCLRMLAKSDKWPEALPDELNSTDEDFQLYRASRILNEFITDDIGGKSFLDFGCGKGHVAYLAANLLKPLKSIGYDIKDDNWEHFEKEDNLLFTTNIKELKLNAPYDIILLNDVLDHCNKPAETLAQIKELKSENAQVFLRMHPWTSRHGQHLHEQLNKSYLHLVFSEMELYSIGVKPRSKIQKYLDPLAEYRNLIANAGFTIQSEDIVTQSLDSFFTSNKKIASRISKNWKDDKNPMLANGVGFPQNILEIQFVDYVLI